MWYNRKYSVIYSELSSYLRIFHAFFLFDDIYKDFNDVKLINIDISTKILTYLANSSKGLIVFARTQSFFHKSVV